MLGVLRGIWTSTSTYLDLWESAETGLAIRKGWSALLGVLAAIVLMVTIVVASFGQVPQALPNSQHLAMLDMRVSALEKSDVEHRLTKIEATIDTNNRLLVGVLITTCILALERILFGGLVVRNGRSKKTG